MSSRGPIVRDVVFSMARMWTSQEALKKSLSAFFTLRQFTSDVKFNSDTKMTLCITPAIEWAPSPGQSVNDSVNALINEALAATCWAIVGPVVREVTLSIGFNRNFTHKRELQKFLTTFATEKQFSLEVEFNSETSMTFTVKAPGNGLNSEAFIIQALTAAQHPLQEGMAFLPKGETWTLSAPGNLHTILAKGEAVLVSGEGASVLASKSSNDVGEGSVRGWNTMTLVELPIQVLVTFSIEFNNDEKKSLHDFLSARFEMNPDFYCKHQFFESKNALRFILQIRKGTAPAKPDIVTIIDEVLTEAGYKGFLGQKFPGTIWNMKPVVGRRAEFANVFPPDVAKSVLKLTSAVLAREGYLSLASAWEIYEESSTTLHMCFTPQKDQNTFLLNVDFLITEALKEAVSRSPSPHNTSTFELKAYDLEGDESERWIPIISSGILSGHLEEIQARFENPGEN